MDKEKLRELIVKEQDKEVRDALFELYESKCKNTGMEYVSPISWGSTPKQYDTYKYSLLATSAV